MSGRLLSARIAPLLRRGLPTTRHLHNNAITRSGGLLRFNGPSRRPWPAGASSIHNVPAFRSISFARVLPRLALKMARIPAMLGASAIAGLAYIQYQATQAGNYAIDVFKRAGDSVGGTVTSMFEGGKGIANQIEAGWQKTKDEMELPEWMQKILRTGEHRGEESGKGGSSGEPPKQSR